MKRPGRRISGMALSLLGSAGMLLSSAGVAAADLREAAPPDAFLAVYSMHNPERDYQKQHFQAVWNTLQETRIFDRALQMIQSRIGEADAEQFLAVRDAIQTAMAPIEWEKLVNAEEFMYAQRMEVPASQHVMLAHAADGGAASLFQGVGNLMRLAEKASGGAITINSQTIEGFSVLTMKLPSGVPFEPLIGTRDDVFIAASSTGIAKESLKLLASPDAVSKFDDERFREALTHLPAAEDAIVFYDGRTMMSQMKGLGGFIRQVSNGNPQAAQFAGLLEGTLAQLDIVDFEITVEYTEGYQNRTASFGRLKSGASQTVAGQMVMNQQLFDNWSRWVPTQTTGFSISNGVTLRPLYTWLIREVPAAFPQLQPGIEKFNAIQDELDLHVDEDILQAFSGESVSLSFPGSTPTPFGKSSESVLFLRCSKPDRIQELLHRGLNALQEIPQVKAQGISLKPAAGLEGFEELTANMMGMVGVRPVIGFRDGWMIIGSHPESVRKAIAVQEGQAESFATGETFQKFNLTVDGPVDAISYSNVGESIRQTSQTMQQAGMMLPMILAMAGQQGGPGGPDLTVIQDIAGLLPSIGKVVGKFDFFDRKLSVTQPGPVEDSWIRNSVTLIRPFEAPARVPAKGTDAEKSTSPGTPKQD